MLRAERHFTTAGEQSGELSRALGEESDDSLRQEYVASVCSPHWANPVFGANFRRWMAAVGAELKRRGIHQIERSDCLGTQVINVR